MGSGNYAGAAGFNNTEKPNTVAECVHRAEPRGPGVFLAGLCVVCGRATVYRRADGLPRHLPPFPPSTCTHTSRLPPR